MSSEKEHWCSEACEEAMKPCDLCLAQRRKRESDKNLSEGKPTLKYNPFAGLKLK
jgi:hypothetical protein